MSSLRSSLKQISILSKKTIDLETKLSVKMDDSQNLLEKMNSTADISLFRTDNPEGGSSGTGHSFGEKYELMEKLG